MKDLNVILKEMFPAIDFEKEDALMSLDSLEVFMLIDKLEQEYNVSIPMDEVSQENFNSMEAINSLIYKLSQ